jgi:retron-type reverse transcriptase
MRLNRFRFIYSLAGALLGGEWTVAGVKKSLSRPPMDRPLRSPKLAERITSAFPHKPEFKSLVKFLQTDAGLARAIARPAIYIPSRITARKKIDAPPSWLSGVELPKLETETELTEWFGIDIKRLRWRADITGRNRRHPPGPMRTYRYRWIPKREGLPRLLEIPKAKLKETQRKILAEILDKIPVHPAAHGFCAGRSIITNTTPHCGQAAVLRFDLMDFFPSITAARVYQIFRSIGYPVDVARLLKGLCTTSLPADVWDARPGARNPEDFLARQRLIGRHLPQGAPTSPALANLAAGRLDRRLAALAEKLGATYTRYADDLTFSGPLDLARTRKRIATLVAVIADDEGFTLNFRKTRLMRAGVRQHVTGVVVNVHPNINRVEFDRLKAILTNCIRRGAAEENRESHPNFRAHLLGRVAHVRSINTARGDKLMKLFAKIVW